MSTHARSSEQGRLVRQLFSKANATAPERAIPLPAFSKGERGQFDRLVESGVIRHVDHDRYYLDESLAGASTALGARIALAVAAILAGLLVFGAKWSSMMHPEARSEFGGVTVHPEPTRLLLREPAAPFGAPRVCFRFRSSSQRANSPIIRAAFVRDNAVIDTMPPAPLRQTGDRTSCLDWTGPMSNGGAIWWTAMDVWADTPIALSQIRVRVPISPGRR